MAGETVAGTLPHGWEFSTLGELGEFRNGVNFNRTQEGTGLPVLKVKDFLSRFLVPEEGLDELDPELIDVPATQMLDAGDTVVIRSNGNSQLVGRSLHLPTAPRRRMTFSGFCIRFRPDPKAVYPLFAAYFIRSPLCRERFTAYGSGTGIQNLSQTILADLPITLPPKPEQQAIARILGTLDDKIELNRRMNETLEAMARAIFKSWFVDFDPVRAKAEGRQPFGMDAATADLFPSSFQDSPLGKIPKGWKAGTIGEIAGLLGGFAFRSQDWVDEGVPVVKIGSVKPGVVDLSKVSYVRPEVAERVQRFRLRPGDLLIGMTGYVGEVGVVPPTGNHPLLNQRVGKFLLQGEPSESLPYVYCLTRRPDFKAQVEGRAHGTAQANISAQALLGIDTMVPPMELRTKFNGTCRPMFEKIFRNLAIDQTLIAIRDALLPKLISGEIRVPCSLHREEVVRP